MPQPVSPSRVALMPLVVIATVVGGSAAAFAYTAGWLSPGRVTPSKVVDALAPPGGPALGHRRNHAKGICFTGRFESNGTGTALSKASVFAQGSSAVLGRFNLATPDPKAADATARVRGLGLQITAPDGQVWRSALIDAPFFPVATPQAFYDLLRAQASQDPQAMPGFVAAHPELANFGAWAKSAPWTASYAEEAYNSLNAFTFTDASGTARAVRWSLRPEAQPVPVEPGDLAGRGPDFLEREIRQRVSQGPVRWNMVVTVADPGDSIADPSKAWPADRRSVTAGMLVVQRIEEEADGPCRDINFDPTVLPAGISTSEDPFPAARSAAYAVSYDRRTAEARAYPRQTAGARP